MTARVQPTLEWYKRKSRDGDVPPRCPFASVQRCPRFYESLSLLGEAGSQRRFHATGTTAFSQSGSNPISGRPSSEQAASVKGPADDPRHLMQLLPRGAVRTVRPFRNRPP